MVRLIATQMARSMTVPFLGAGANLCGRPPGSRWEKGQRLPSGEELAQHLAAYAAVPHAVSLSLARVSQYVEAMLGQGPLYRELSDVLDADYPPSPVHHFLAKLPQLLGDRNRTQLAVTTNYDDSLERAFLEADHDFDLVTYLASPTVSERGKFLHTAPGGTARVIDRPNEYRGLDLERRSVILKIHGAVDRTGADTPGYVITEDDYIEYMAVHEGSSFLPVELDAMLQNSHIVFMGYALSDWNLRVFFRKLWGGGRPPYNSWAVQLDPDPLETKFWTQRGVEILAMELGDFVTAVRQFIRESQSS